MQIRFKAGWLLPCLLVFLWLFPVEGAKAAVNDILIRVNDNVISTEAPARMISNRVMIPVRSVSEALGGQVDWNNTEKRVTITSGSQRVSARIGNAAAQVNGTTYQLDVPPVIISGRLYVPIRFFAEGLGAGVTWYGSTREVHILSRGYTAPAGEIWGYYYGSGALHGLEEASTVLNRVVIDSFTVDDKGNLTEKHPYPQGLETAREKRLPVSIMIFQTDKQVLGTLLSSSTARSNFIKQIAELVQTRGYDGVDLDLEGVPENARQAFVQLTRDLKAVLKPMNKMLSLSLPAKENESISWRKGYDYAGLGAVADRVTIMTYDQHYSGGEPGPVAALDWVERVMRFASTQIPKQKLLMGIGSYGYDWPPTGKAQSVTVEKVRDLLQSHGVTPSWDQQAQVPHFSYVDDEGRRHQVWYENQDSLAKKVALAKSLGLRGLTVWRLGFPPPEFWEFAGQSF